MTPATNGTILGGITRKSVIEIALDLGYKVSYSFHICLPLTLFTFLSQNRALYCNGQVEERRVPVEELKEAGEVFCTGTATGVASVGSITFQNTRSLLLLLLPFLNIHVYITYVSA